MDQWQNKDKTELKIPNQTEDCEGKLNHTCQNLLKTVICQYFNGHARWPRCSTRNMSEVNFGTIAKWKVNTVLYSKKKKQIKKTN